MNALNHLLSAPHEAPSARRVAFVASARSADQAFLCDLGASAHWRGRVHSVFQHVINIEGANGELFTLASRDIDDAPNTMVVEMVDFSKTGVAMCQQVVATAGVMRIDSALEVHFDHAKGWQGTLPVYDMASGRLGCNLDALAQFLQREDALSGMLRSTLRGSDDGLADGNNFDHAVSRMLSSTTSRLRDAILRQDSSDACAQARLLMGLGPGLTPSGDDFLVGLFAVLHVKQSPLFGLGNLCLEMVAGAEHTTNAISYAALSKAATGRVRACMAELIQQLLHGEADAWTAPLQRVLAIGSTSGSDIVAGIVCGLRLQLEFERSGKPWQPGLPTVSSAPSLMALSGQPQYGG